MIRLRIPIAWMGLGNMPYGLYGAVTLVTVPQILASRGVPQPTIAAITATAMIPSFCAFLLAPMLDVRFSRRSYAFVFGTLSAVIAGVALTQINSPGVLTALLVTGFVCAALFYSALGGWLGSVVRAGDEGRLGSTMTVGNIGGFGMGAILFLTFYRALPSWLATLVIAACMALPMVLLLMAPHSATAKRGARESYTTLARDLAKLLRNRIVLRMLLLFCLPAASFALTNSLPALGGEFGASERFVALVAGLAATFAAVVTGLAMPVVIKRLSPLLLYVLIGITGGLFTLVVLIMPRVPVVFATAIIGENVFQTAAFVVEATLIFRTIGANNPLAATQYSLLAAAPALPIVYMQAIDGQGYGIGGLNGSLATDAGFTLAACAILLPIVLLWWRKERVAAEPLPTTA